MTLDPSKGRELLAIVVSATTRNESGEAAVVLLNFLLKQLEELRVAANGYPRQPIAGDVWFDGKTLAELCDELTEVLSTRELPEQQELASRIATGMACQVMGHYPEEIFPRVLRNARCREAIDQLQEAVGGYEAIVSDFSELGLDYLLEDDAPLEEPGRVILGAVLDAADRLVVLSPERAAELQPLATQARRRLAWNT